MPKRTPTPSYRAIVQLAEESGTSLSELCRRANVSRAWLERLKRAEPIALRNYKGIEAEALKAIQDDNQTAGIL